jgi:uncharacterized membrane protein
VDPQQPYAAPAPAKLDVGAALGYGFGWLKANLGPLAMIGLVFFGYWVVSNVIGFVIDDQVVLSLVQGLWFLLGAIINLGLVRIGLKATRGELPEVGDLFRTERFGPFLGGYLLFTIAAIIGFVFCIVPGVFVLILLWFFGYLIVERGSGAIDSLQEASELTKGNRGEVFLLGLACVGINILGAIPCGLGLIVTVPATYIASGYAYRSLAGEAIAPIPNAGV